VRSLRPGRGPHVDGERAPTGRSRSGIVTEGFVHAGVNGNGTGISIIGHAARRPFGRGGRLNGAWRVRGVLNSWAASASM